MKTRDDLRKEYEELADGVAALHNARHGKRGHERQVLSGLIDEFSDKRDRAEAALIGASPHRTVKWRKLGRVHGYQIMAHLDAGLTTHEWTTDHRRPVSGNLQQICTCCGKTRELATSKTTGRQYIVER